MSDAAATPSRAIVSWALASPRRPARAFAETIAAQSGVGYMAMQAREFLLVDVVVLSILIYALLGKLADSTARLLERLCLSWHPAFQT